MDQLQTDQVRNKLLPVCDFSYYTFLVWSISIINAFSLVCDTCFSFHYGKDDIITFITPTHFSLSIFLPLTSNISYNLFLNVLHNPQYKTLDCRDLTLQMILNI